MSLPFGVNEDLGICQNPHPLSVTYRLQRLDPFRMSGPPYCPWCDWRRLRAAPTGRPDPWTSGAEWRNLRHAELAVSISPD